MVEIVVPQGIESISPLGWRTHELGVLGLVFRYQQG
jgi:hypothetical protein